MYQYVYYVSLESRMKAKRSSHIPPSTHIARSCSSTFPQSKDRVKGGKGSLPSFLPTFIPSSLELGKFDTKFNGLISTGRWRHDRPRQAERARERRLLRRTTANGAGKWDFKLFAVLAIDAVVGTVGREKPEPTERGRRARSAEMEGGKEWYRLSS